MTSSLILGLAFLTFALADATWVQVDDGYQAPVETAGGGDQQLDAGKKCNPMGEFLAADNTCKGKNSPPMMPYTGFETFTIDAQEIDEKKRNGAPVQPGVAMVTFKGTSWQISIKMLEELDELASLLEKDTKIKVTPIRVVVFQAFEHRSAFYLAQADMNMLADIASKKTGEPTYLAQVLQRISNLPQATIAKVRGRVGGAGHEFILACDMRFASKVESKFQQMEVGYGTTPMGGASPRLVQLVGMGRALQIMLGAEEFDADKAEKYGTINLAYQPKDIDRKVGDLADRMAQFSLEAMAAIKRSAFASVGKSIAEGLKVEAVELKKTMTDGPAAGRIEWLKLVKGNTKYLGNAEKNLLDLQACKDEKSCQDFKCKYAKLWNYIDKAPECPKSEMI